MTAPLPTTAVLPLGRSTFDVEFAGQNLAAMIAALEAAGVPVRGSRELLVDADSVRAAISELQTLDVEQVLVLQVTFTDAEMTAEIADTFDLPLSIWAIPEPRAGARLRSNSFCGLNLAGHALGLRGQSFSYLYAAPDGPDMTATITGLLTGAREVRPGAIRAERPAANEAGKAAAAKLRGLKIGRIGEHPAGFDTCAYDPAQLEDLAAIQVDEFPLDTLFARARNAAREDVGEIRAQAESDLGGLDNVDQIQLDRSLRLRNALDALKSEHQLDAFAIRCWPETFTEYGGAVCGPVAMMGERRTPCACEADVYGAVTSFLLQEIADEPVFLVDLVDLDCADDTGVVWHCGQAPISMCDEDFKAEATIHTNRKMPLLYQFPLKPGRVTFARVSQGLGERKLVIAGGEMLKRPMAFTGTSGVVRFDAPAENVLRGVMDCGLEHHMALAYGDHRDDLRGAAAALDLPVVELS